MSKTICERLSAALSNRGWTIDLRHLTSKYVVMQIANPEAHKVTKLRFTRDGNKCRYFLGSNGALRYSARGTVKSSVPHEITKKALLAEYASAKAHDLGG